MMLIPNALNTNSPVSPRIDALFTGYRQQNYRRTDQMFGVLMIIQWVAGMIAASWLSPYTWSGTEKQIHPHLWAAVFLGGAISLFPIVLAFFRPGETYTRYTIAVGQMLMGALLIHLSGGRIETHFHVFGSLAFLAFYRDWEVLVPATLVVMADHIVRGIFFPQSIFGVLASSNWRWLEHVGWVAFIDVFLIISCLRGKSEMKEFAAKTTALEIAEKRSAIEIGELKYRELFENANDLIFTHDLEGHLSSVNKASETITGYSRDEAVRMNIRQIIAPDYRQYFQKLTTKMITERKPVSYEVIIVTKDGASVWLEASARLIYEDGAPVGVQGIARDITERKHNEEEIKIRQVQLNEAQHVAQIGSWEWDLIKKSISWSDELYRILGFEPQSFEVTFEAFLKLIHPDDRETVSQTVTHSLNAKEPFEYDARIIQPDKTMRTIYANGVVSIDESGVLTKLMGTVQDITERRKMEMVIKNARDAALEATRVKSEFLANMSHEIRTPMNGIIGMTELMLDTALEGEQERYVNNIKSCSDSLLTILNDILDISKMEAGKLHFENVDFDLRYSVENVVELLAERAHQKKLEIAAIFHPGVPAQLCGDPTRIRQILTNLVSNAIKFTETGEVVVNVSKVSEDDRRAVIRFDIKDTGIGISEEAGKLLFSPFNQADTSITRLYGGTGLGLTISKQLVEMMDGEISIAGQPGCGTTVTFTISLIKQASQEQPVFPTLNSDLKDLRVLVVDDNETNRLVLTEQMSEWGIIVEDAANGPAGLKKLRTAASSGNPFQIAILDHVMPGITGLETATLIKAEALIAGTHLILMTSFAERGHGKAARQAGIRAYFNKPVRQSMLLECLSVVIGEDAFQKKSDNKLITHHSLGAMKASLNKHILLVEDNEVNRQVALGHLSSLGYRIDVASNGEEAVKAVAGQKYDAILMDCQMPVMDGFQATAEIRKLEGSSRHTPIVAMTAHAMSSDRTKCLAAGMDAYLAKPVRKSDLKELLHNILENSGSESLPAAPEEIRAETTEDLPPVDLAFLMDIASDDYERVEEFVELYSHHTAEWLDELSTAVNSRSVEDVYAIAHKCLGSSRTLGMTVIVPPLRELERIARAGDLNGAEEQLNIAKDAFENITKFLAQNLEPVAK